METEHRELTRLLFHTAKGDQDAFRTLYEQTSARLYSVCLRLLRDREAAEEVLQEAYVCIWHQAQSYSPKRGEVVTWMISIARYRAIDLLRRRGRRPETDLEDISDRALADRQPGPAEHASLATDAAALARCMELLTDMQRQAIQLAFLHGLTHEEVSTQLGSPLGSVKSWVRRGLQGLKRCLQS